MAQPESIHNVAEWLRCLVTEVEQRSKKPDEYFYPAECYVQRPSQPECLHGASCRQDSAWHWHQFDHPELHPLLVSTPAQCPTWKLGELQSCRHFTRSGSCQAANKCRFEHTLLPLPLPPAASSSSSSSSSLLGSADASADPGQAWASSGKQRATRKKRSAYNATACFRRFLIGMYMDQ